MRNSGPVNTSSNTMGLGGINLANISYSDANTSNRLLRGEPEEFVTVAEHMVPLKEVFYINDLVIINKALAGKLLKCGLEGSSIMVRSAKDKFYDSSEQIQIGQTKIMGFLDVDKLVNLCRTTQWQTYKIWQAVKAGDLTYSPATFVCSDTSLKDALKHMIVNDTRFTVVKKGHREVGMIGETLIRETLNKHTLNLDEESKD